MENTVIIKELLKLRNDYEQSVRKTTNKREELTHKKVEVYEGITKEIDISINNSRLESYLKQTDISNFCFLDRSFRTKANNKKKEHLSFSTLLFLDSEINDIGLEYGITSVKDFETICYDCYIHNVSHPFLEDIRVQKKFLKVTKLAYLDDIFKDINNILDYQGVYTVYKYVKNRLNEILIIDSPKNDDELVYKDYNQKLKLVISNLSNIASYLLQIREQIPYSRLAVGNQGLYRTSKKSPGTPVSDDQNIFAEAIAFGTTLEKLKDGNYEDAKQLIFLPHQKIVK